MQKTERLIVYGVLIACVLLGLRAQVVSPAVAAGAGAPAGGRADEPAPARLATCDVYEVVEKLVAGERYESPRKREEDRIRDKLKPMEDELAAMEAALKGADPNDAPNQEKAREFQKRRSDYLLIRGSAQQEYTDFVAAQYVEAFKAVRTAVAAVAERLGYTHVLASRSQEKPITATDPERLIEAFLGRPMTVSPEGSDITDRVKVELKVE